MQEKKKKSQNPQTIIHTGTTDNVYKCLAMKNRFALEYNIISSMSEQQLYVIYLHLDKTNSVKILQEFMTCVCRYDRILEDDVICERITVLAALMSKNISVSHL